MLRRRIPVLVLIALAVLAVAVDAASARPRDRRSNRQQNNQPNTIVDPVQQQQLMLGQQQQLLPGQQQLLLGQQQTLDGQQIQLTSDQQIVDQQGRPVGRMTRQGQQNQQIQQAGYRAYYRMPTPDAPIGSVLLNVTVPPDARVLIDGNETRQMGTNRRFVSPQLPQGRQFSYQVTAMWQENGREVKRTRQVPVQAGQEVFVDLTQQARADRQPQGTDDDAQPRRNQRTTDDEDQPRKERKRTNADDDQPNRKKTGADDADDTNTKKTKKKTDQDDQ